MLMVVPLNSMAQDYDKGMAAARTGDFETALNELGPLAEQGHGDAQNSLGTIYRNGEGVAQDYPEAARWFRLAAEQGNPFAQFNLGKNYYLGIGLAQNNISALMWWAITAAQGDQDADENIGYLASEISKNDLLNGLRRARVCMESNYTNRD